MIDATTDLVRALVPLLGQGGDVAMTQASSKSWASATFDGAHHQIHFRLTCPQRDHWLPALPARLEAHEFTLRGHLVADIHIAQFDDRPDAALIMIEALTVEES